VKGGFVDTRASTDSSEKSRSNQVDLGPHLDGQLRTRFEAAFVSRFGKSPKHGRRNSEWPYSFKKLRGIQKLEVPALAVTG
jgi:hypothetical protein